jgi:hypothetical protein
VHVVTVVTDGVPDLADDVLDHRGCQGPGLDVVGESLAKSLSSNHNHSSSPRTTLKVRKDRVFLGRLATQAICELLLRHRRLYVRRSGRKNRAT